ncbi:ABC transporter substrate-binding protein [Nocardioides panaciterrulae]|uniref:Osmoprotectant transport system substrate-binding protein n=1 Tax=Nocardioides panaciterrulae TaxID=661492 RepID=A0A7Y9E9M0_9ACTN|nr:ABC transporter substrate-binding protein [Nocardioides panaciterrulae]NYD43547.1 osmoprotectant transport system substrate-binding protein [Nocardioides panaciterrulae]
MQVRRPFAAVLAVGTLLLASACAGDNLSNGKSGSSPSDSASSGSADKGAVHIAGQNFPEAQLVAAMYDELLTKAGYDTDVKLVDSRDVYMKTFPGAVDVVPEYVGGILDYLNTTQNGAKAKPITTSDAQASIEAGKSLLSEQGITLLDPSQATDTNAFFVSKDYASSENVSTLSDLKGKSVVLAAAPDCEGRQDCEGGLSGAYGIDVTKVLPLGYASDQTYQSVLKGESQLGETSTTDGTLESQGLVLLDDDKHIQPAQNLVPAVSSDFLAAHPDVAGTLNGLMAALTTEKLTQLNGEVTVDRKTPADVADEFLTQAGLV